MTGDFFSDMLTAIGVFFMVVVVLVLAYFLTKQMGTHMLRQQQTNSMKVLERMMISQDKGLFIVQIGQRYCLIGVAQSGIQLLMELEEEDIGSISNPSKQMQKTSIFFDILSEKIKKK